MSSNTNDPLHSSDGPEVPEQSDRPEDALRAPEGTEADAPVLDDEYVLDLEGLGDEWLLLDESELGGVTAQGSERPGAAEVPLEAGPAEGAVSPPLDAASPELLSGAPVAPESSASGAPLPLEEDSPEGLFAWAAASDPEVRSTEADQPESVEALEAAADEFGDPVDASDEFGDPVTEDAVAETVESAPELTPLTDLDDFIRTAEEALTGTDSAVGPDEAGDALPPPLADASLDAIAGGEDAAGFELGAPETDESLSQGVEPDLSGLAAFGLTEAGDHEPASVEEASDSSPGFVAGPSDELAALGALGDPTPALDDAAIDEGAGNEEFSGDLDLEAEARKLLGDHIAEEGWTEQVGGLLEHATPEMSEEDAALAASLLSQSVPAEQAEPDGLELDPEAIEATLLAELDQSEGRPSVAARPMARMAAAAVLLIGGAGAAFWFLRDTVFPTNGEPTTVAESPEKTPDSRGSVPAPGTQAAAAGGAVAAVPGDNEATSETPASEDAGDAGADPLPVVEVTDAELRGAEENGSTVFDLPWVDEPTEWTPPAQPTPPEFAADPVTPMVAEVEVPRVGIDGALEPGFDALRKPAETSESFEVLSPEEKQELIARGLIYIEANGHVFQGRVRRIRGRELTLHMPRGEMTFDLTRATILEAGDPALQSPEQLREAVVILRNGQRFRGRLLKDDQTGVVLKFDAGSITLARADVDRVSYVGRVSF